MELWSSSILLEFLAFVPQGSLGKPLPGKYITSSHGLAQVLSTTRVSCEHPLDNPHSRSKFNSSKLKIAMRTLI